MDARGKAARGAFGRDAAGGPMEPGEALGGMSKRPKKVQRYGEDGQKQRYFADDDEIDLQTLVKRAKVSLEIIKYLKACG